MTWVITGANRGIGLEYVHQLLETGEQVIAAVRDSKNADELIQLGQNHTGLTIEQVDMANLASVRALAIRLAGRPIDVLVNNAGLYGGSWADSAHRQSAIEMDFDLWEKIMRVNVMAPYLMAQVLLPNLLLGTRKLLVNMSSDLGSIYNNLQGQSYAYRSSKAALNMVTKGLSVDLAGLGVTVVAMAPGWTKTDLGGTSALWDVPESVSRQRQVLASVSMADTGSFKNLLGETVAW